MQKFQRDDGSEYTVRSFEEQSAAYLVDYPIKEGWAIRVVRQSLGEAFPDIAERFQSYWSRKFESQDSEGVHLGYVVFTANLVKVDSPDFIWATASSMKEIREIKDFEAGETQAKKRLLRHLGYPDGFEEDVSSDMANMGYAQIGKPEELQDISVEAVKKPDESQPQESEPADEPVTQLPDGNEDKSNQQGQDKQEDTPTAKSKAKSTEKKGPVPPTTSAGFSEDKKLELIRRQVRARLQPGQDEPQMDDMKQALGALKLVTQKPKEAATA